MNPSGPLINYNFLRRSLSKVANYGSKYHPQMLLPTLRQKYPLDWLLLCRNIGLRYGKAYYSSQRLSARIKPLKHASCVGAQSRATSISLKDVATSTSMRAMALASTTPESWCKHGPCNSCEHQVPARRHRYYARGESSDRQDRRWGYALFTQAFDWRLGRPLRGGQTGQ